MNNTLSGYQEATGEIDYTFTNDYMFRAILQTNALVLKGLISSLLHMPLENIKSVHIENPIELGKAISNKDFILDIRILLNDDTIINLEMQVKKQHNWTDHSLLYLCRSFDRISKGQPYETILPAIHIGILDFTLFPNAPEFYASHKLLNVKTHQLYSDKLTLNVLSLKNIELATEEDKQWEIDKWAKLFAAKTWRDIKMIAKDNDILTSAVQSLYTINSDELIREQCQAREDYERHERTMQKKLADSAKTITELTETISQQEQLIQELKLNNQNLHDKNLKLENDIQNLYAIVQSLRNQ